MTALQRSTTSFRRQGSSGLVWDDRFLSGELNKMKVNKEGNNETVRSEAVMRRSRSEGMGSRGGRSPPTPKLKASTPTTPTEDPPSPKVSACGFCGAFGKRAPNLKKRK
ncbi:hypothetical protein SLE2022_265840 [Rubroshorea leprosula]